MIDLRSDTVTKPTAGMRAAIAAAEVGDDVFGEDPTLNALERRVAELFGKEAGLFVPSGTQANQVAIRCLTEPGDEVILEASAHPFLYEAGGPAVISGVTLRPVPGVAGVLDPDVVRAAVRPPNVHHSPARLLSVENTANRGGGTVVSLDRVRELCAVARAAGLRTHLDGARIWNAHVASGVALADYAAPFDIVNVCFSKGLGAPVGSMVLLPRDLLEKARRVRKMLGGGMRQAGLLAAACHYALDHHVARLADDHARARRLWEGLTALGIAATRPDTNMVYVTVPDAPAVATRLGNAGVRCIALSHDQIRLVTHLEIGDADVEGAIAAFRGVVGR